MPQFSIRAHLEYYSTVIVEASDEDEAMRKFNDGDFVEDGPPKLVNWDNYGQPRSCD